MSSDRISLKKFAVAISGVAWAARHQNSFRVHLPVAAAAIALSAWLQVEPWRWVAVVLAITIVISAELLNTSLEQLVRVLHPNQHPQIGRALDAAAGAVLIAASGAVAVGLVTLGPPLWNAIAEKF